MGWLGSFAWSWILFWWLWTQNGRVRAQWIYISSLGVLQVLTLLLTPFPILGNFFDIAFKFAITLSIVLLIHKIKKQDEEYNKKMGKSLAQKLMANKDNTPKQETI